MATNSVSRSSSTTSQLVDQLVYLDSEPIRSNNSKIKAFEEKKKIIQDINSKVLDLQKEAQNLFKTLNEPTKTVKPSKENIGEITVNDPSISGNINLDVKQLATNLVVGGDKFSGEIGVSGSFDITTGDKTATIEINEKDTIDTIRKKINSCKDIGVSANIIDGRLTISSKETGNNSVKFNDPDNILNKIGILNDSGDIKNVLQEGKNAIFNLNGIDIERSSNTITDAAEGITIKLQDVGNVSFNIEEDADKLVESFEKFVESYNKTMNAINTELTKEKGPLRGDSTLSQLKSNLRTAMNSFSSNSAFKNLASIGMGMSSSNYGKNATLEITKKDDLKKALLTNKEEVLKLFHNDSNNNGKLDKGDTGILGTLNKFLDDAASSKGKYKGTLQLKLETINSSIKSLESRNTRLEASIEKKRALYEKQFYYMDQMVSNFTDQGTMLLNSFATFYQY